MQSYKYICLVPQSPGIHPLIDRQAFPSAPSTRENRHGQLLLATSQHVAGLLDSCLVKVRMHQAHLTCGQHKLK